MGKLFMLAAATFISMVFTASALSGEANLTEQFKSGRKLLFENCIDCHELDWPLNKTAARAEWEATLDKMADQGANVNEAARKTIIDFLVAKSDFDTKCVGCHDKEQSMSKRKSLEDWEATVKRMAGKSPDTISESDITVISAYLAAVRSPK